MKSATADPQKLMERLVAAPQGDPLQGVLTTTFELQPDFVETDYLPTLFALGAWDDRSWSSRIAVERRLDGLQTATVFFAAERYHGRPRSLRVEVVPVHKAGQGVLHAKVSLFMHEESVRLLVTSANLTEPGYRRNREVAVALQASEKRPQHASLIRSCLEKMPDVLREWWSSGAEALVRAARERLDEWAADAGDDADEWFAWGGTSSPLWRQFLDRWPRDEAVQNITIVSPFWSDTSGDEPVSRLLGTLASEGSLVDGARVRLLTEACPDASGSVRPVLPDSYGQRDFRAMGVIATAQAVDPTVSREDSGGVDDRRPRPLHAKVVLLEGPRTTLAYAGSANYTSRGWGFLPRPQTANIEAGLILRRTGKAREVLRALVPPARGAAVPLDGGAGEHLAVLGDESPTPPWPAFVRRVELVSSKERAAVQDLEVTVHARSVAGPWSISVDGLEADAALLLSKDGLEPDAEPTRAYRLHLSSDQHRRLLMVQSVLVRWWGSEDAAEFPLNVEESARADLPLAPGAGNPGEQLLLQYYQSRIAFEDLFPPQPGSDEEGGEGNGQQAEDSGVDTSTIQSYQVREFVEALRGIQDDLRRSAMAPATMRLALLGVVSPVALAESVVQAVQAHTRTATAAAFQVVEILGCLGSVRLYTEVPERHREAWCTLVDEAIGRVETHLESLRDRDRGSLTGNTAFTRYERAVRELHGIATVLA